MANIQVDVHSPVMRIYITWLPCLGCFLSMNYCSRLEMFSVLSDASTRNLNWHVLLKCKSPLAAGLILFMTMLCPALVVNTASSNKLMKYFGFVCLSVCLSLYVCLPACLPVCLFSLVSWSVGWSVSSTLSHSASWAVS